MSDSDSKQLFTDEELAAGDTPAADDEVVNDQDADNATATPVDYQGGAGEAMNGIDEGAMQAMADQLASLDDNAMGALVRGMPDESRQSLCSAVAGTLSDEQLEQCGLSKSVDMAGAGAPDQDPELQSDMDEAQPEQPLGGTFMSLTQPKKKAQPHPHSAELARMKATKLLDRAKAVHAKNPAVITEEQLAGIEANLQGQRCLSLLEPNNGDLAPITLLVAMGERMVQGESNDDLLKVNTVNMSLTGDEDCNTAKPVKKPSHGGFDDDEAKKFAEERWSKKNQTPAMTD